MACIAVGAILVGIFFLAAFFSAPGYVIFLIVGKEYALWSAAGAGLGSIVLLLLGGSMIGHIIKMIKS